MFGAVLSTVIALETTRQIGKKLKKKKSKRFTIT
jgi:hypothetical protein